MNQLRKRLAAFMQKNGRSVYSAALGLIALICAWMGYAYGGYYVSGWAPAAFVLAGLMLAVSLLGVLGGARSWWSVVATSLFIGYAAWTFASISWSANRSDAWSGAGMTLMYLLVFWLCATFVALNASRRWTLAALCIGPGIVAAITIPTLGSDGMFESNRLLGSVGYFNAEAAFLLISFWSGIYVAGSRRVHPALRAAALASLVVGVELAVLTQSRGAMVALAVSFPVFFLFSGQRLRGFLAFVPIAGSLFITFPGLNDVYLALSGGGSASGAINDVTPTIWATTAGAGVYALIWSIIDRRWRPSGAFMRVARVVALVSVVVLLLAGGTFFVERIGSPVAWTQERWVAFKTNDVSGQEDSRYMSAGGSGRYTLWKVALRDFTEHPVLGVGSQNYESTYYRYRDGEVGWVKQPHSLPLEVLAERGLIGGVLFFGFLGTCFVAGFYKRYSALNSEGKAQVGAVTAAVVYWFTQSSAEWFWQIPAVTIPAMIYLSMLVAPWDRLRESERVFAPSDRPLRLAGIGLVALTLVAIGPLYAADRLKERADADDNPWQALGEIERARDFNPLDPSLARAEAALAYRIGDIPLATASYARSIELNPDNYASYAVLGGVYEELGQPERALSLYRDAERLNPLEDSVQQSIQRVQRQLKENS